MRGGFGCLLPLAGSQEEEAKEACEEEAKPREALRKRAKVHRVGHELGEFVDLEEVAAVARLGVGLLRASGNKEASDTFTLRGAEEGCRAEAGGRLRQTAYQLERLTLRQCLLSDALERRGERDLGDGRSVEGLVAEAKQSLGSCTSRSAGAML